MYITESDLENHILQDIDSTYSTWIGTIIGFVEDYIDKYCGTSFASLGSVTRYYDGSGVEDLSIDNLTAISSVQILNSNGDVESNLTENTDYWLYPLNETVKNKIVLTGTNLIGSFPDRLRAIKVIGTFGYSSVPSPVKFAGIQLAAKIINEGLRGGQVSSESLGSYNISYKDIDEKVDSMGIKEILNQYRESRMY